MGNLLPSAAPRWAALEEQTPFRTPAFGIVDLAPRTMIRGSQNFMSRQWSMVSNGSARRLTLYPKSCLEITGHPSWELHSQLSSGEPVWWCARGILLR